MTHPRRPHRLSVSRWLILCSTVLLFGASCFKGQEPVAPAPFSLMIWSVNLSEADLQPLLNQYKGAYPYVSFDIRTLEPDNYEQALFDAWARGQGPDIFVVPNGRLGRFAEVITPMPETVTLKKVETQQTGGGIGNKKTSITEQTIQQLVPTQIADLCVGPVSADVVRDGTIIGLPLSMDTLALYYNRDLMAAAQVAIPPTTWDEFLNVVQAMVVTADSGDGGAKTLVRPAADVGTFDNVPHAFDLVSALMMQSGAQMTDDTGRVTFGTNGENLTASRTAIDFYRKFADPKFTSYTWDDQQTDALSLFAQGNLGMYFGYLSDEATIKQRSGTLNFSRTKLPQINPEAPINYANYPVAAVYVQTAHADHAWNFVRFMTTDETTVQAYVDATDQVSALRTIVGKQQQDADRGLFAQQAITAQTWYHGVDPSTATDAFGTMITAAVSETSSLEDIITLAGRTIDLTTKSN